MLDSQHLLPQSHTTPQPPTKHTSKSTTQHGIHIILLHVPAETLTGITSYLDPPALCALAAVNVYLHEHVKDDNTWRRAFVYQFLGIGPESDLDDQKTTLLLRPAEHSWRQEFTVRYRVARRWERSRNATTTHIPVNSPISSMHLMSSQSPVHYLLTSSLQYGIIARSIPLTGRILPGYLDASASAAVQGFGMGNGNPNAQFTPNVSACAITSDGGKAKVVWGTRVGDVLFMVAPRAMEGGGRTGRSGVEMKRCRVGDEHAGAVLDAQWLDSEWTVVTAGADGRVKLWDAKTGTCQWTSPTKPNVFIPDPCVKVMISASSVIAGVMKSGDIHLWTGVEFRETIIPCPILTSTQGYNPDVAHGLTALHIDPNSPTSKPTLLVAYEYDPYFYRVFVDLTKEDEESINTTAFGDPFFGAISSIVPFFRSKSMSETSFVLAGDHFGCVSLYSWDSTTSDIVGPQRKIEAHPDSSSVTAIAWNSYTLVTGSARGTTHVFDALTWRHLRSFASPVPRVRGGRHAHHPVVVGAVGAGNAQGNANEEEMEAQRQRERQSVRHIVLSPTERDILFVGVGDRVMAWKAGAVPRHASGGVRGRHASGTAVGKKKRAGGKYMQQLELSESIKESRHLLADESEHVRLLRQKKASGGREEREQQARLETMGLSEVEAVEYVLMLSRDEATRAASSLDDEGVFEGDFEEDDDDDFDDGDEDFVSAAGTMTRRNSTSTTSTSTSSSSVYRAAPAALSFSSSSSSAGSVSSRSSRSSRSGTPSLSNRKIQVAPRETYEPLEAGQEYLALSAFELAQSQSQSAASLLGPAEDSFPPISGSSNSLAAQTGEKKDEGEGKGKKKKKNRTAASSPTKAIPVTGGCAIVSSSASSSPKSVKSTSTSPSAWTIPLADRPAGNRNIGSSPVSSGSGSGMWLGSASVPRNAWVGPSRVSVSPPTVRNAYYGGGVGAGVGVGLGDDLDDDLRFALELSLVEARSRGEDV